MASRRPRLPMLLGLAVLTTLAHLLAAGAHMFGGHGAADWPLLILLGLAPIGGIALAMTGRPRHGAIILALTMFAAGAWTLFSHFLVADDLTDTFAYTWVVQMTLAFELQGFALGAILVIRPQAPRARDASPAG